MKYLIFVLALSITVNANSQSVNSFEEIVENIISDLDEESIELLENTSKDDLIEFHFGWGMGIRNGLNLWQADEELLTSICGVPDCHPEDASMAIIYGVWNTLHKLPLREDLRIVHIQRIEQ